MSVKLLDRTKFIETMKKHLRIDPKRTALVSVDMHQGHLDPDVATMLVPTDERTSVLKNAKRLVEIAKKHKIAIIHVILQLRPIERERATNPFSVTAEAVKNTLAPEELSWQGKEMPAGWWQPKIMPEVTPHSEDYVIGNKKTYSAYTGTDLEHLLRTLGVDTVVLIGINTNTCVLCSSFETVNRGFRLIIVSDCVASAYGQDLHIFGLQNVARCLGWVLTVKELEEKLKG
jgi:nicotinamidase-related amidase